MHTERKNERERKEGTNLLISLSASSLETTIPYRVIVKPSPLPSSAGLPVAMHETLAVSHGLCLNSQIFQVTLQRQLEKFNFVGQEFKSSASSL